MTLLEAIVAESKRIEIRRKPAHDAVKVRIMSGGRKASWAPNRKRDVVDCRHWCAPADDGA